MQNPTDTTTDGWVRIRAGDNIIFTAGQTWTSGSIVIDSMWYDQPESEAGRITLKSSSNTSRAIFDMTGESVGIFVKLRDYISFEYLEIKNATHRGIRISRGDLGYANNIKILYSYIHDIRNASHALTYCVNDEAGNGTEVAYSILQNCEAKYIGTNESLPTINGDYHHNIMFTDAGFIDGPPDHGFVLTGRGHRAYNNIIWTEKETVVKGYCGKMDGLAGGSANDNNWIYNNLCIGWSAGWANIESMGTIGNRIVGNTTYLNNINGSSGNRERGDMHCLRLEGNPVHNTIVANNICYYQRPASEGSGAGFSWQVFFPSPSSSVTGNIVRNNLFYYNGSAERFRIGSSNSTESQVASLWHNQNNNEWANNRVAVPDFSGGIHPISNLPKGFDANWFPNDIGLMLAESSVAKDIGLNVSNYDDNDEFEVDIQGISRPQGSAWDIGAYEFVQGGGGTLTGDLNTDGSVNLADWFIMLGRWLAPSAAADLNNDGIVNTIDFSILNSNWSH